MTGIISGRAGLAQVGRLDLVCAILENMPPVADTAAQVHVAAAEALRAGGFDVVLEWRTSDGGRIDIVAMRDTWSVAIEIDARKPRARSLLKLRGFLGAKVIALRGVAPLLPYGIDAAICIPVRTATQAERDDRRTASRVRA